jgi:DNA repair protein RadD
MNLRPYQSEAVQSVLSYWQDGGGDPLIEMATGTGKSVVVANLVRALTEGDPETRILMLVHVRELVAQNAQALLRVWPGAPLGINSAGLGRRDRQSQILYASIQSVAREDAHSLGARHVVLIDEAHLVPQEGDGQYRKLIDRLREREPQMRVVGFTATPYRLGSGLLYGKGATFSDVVYSYGIAEGVKDGYLSPLTSRLGAHEIDVSSVRRSGGEFVASALQDAARSPSQIVQSCEDAAARLENRKSWLVFCTGVQHAQDVADQLRLQGINAACVTGETPKHERDRLLQAFKAGQIRAMTNANVLTTGFDAPCVDAVVMMRPTLSTGLYVQMLGRGTRLYLGKENCLVLDYAGNVRRHGPVDAIEIRGRRGDGGAVEKTNVDSVRAKECPSCGALVGLAKLVCDDCGHSFPRAEKEIAARPEREAAVMTSELEQVWHECGAVEVARHNKPDGIASLRVEYQVGFSGYREWITLDHPGFAGAKALVWWLAVTGGKVNLPDAGDRVDTAIAQWASIRPRRAWIQIKRDGKYWRVTARRFVRHDGLALEIDETMKARPFEMEKEAA